MSASNRTKYLDTNTIQGPVGRVNAVHVPADGSRIKSVEVNLIYIRDETGKTRLFPDGRPFWGEQAISVANAFVMSLADKQPVTLNGDYYVFKTDSVAALPLNAYLARRSRGVYGDALILKLASVGREGPRFRNVDSRVMRPDVLRGLLDAINAL